MTTAELKEYLAMVVQTEKEVNLQEQLFRQINRKINEYDQAIIELTRWKSTKTAPSEPVYEKSGFDGELGCSLIIFYVIVCIVTSELGFKQFGSYFGIVMAGLVIAGVIVDKKSREKSYKQKINKYDEDCATLQATIQEEKTLRLKEIEKLKTQKQIAEVERQQVENALASSRRNLEKMYSYNIVFPKYRNYVMVSSIYEYLCAGRCTALDGHEGAYNILELEIRLDRIITQLDRIIMNLEAIRANQYTLYTCLQESNQRIDMFLQEESRMADSLQGIASQTATMNARLADMQKSSELTNYLAECNQRELHYMNRMNYLAGHYDNPYGNYTPV